MRCNGQCSHPPTNHSPIRHHSLANQVHHPSPACQHSSTATHRLLATSGSVRVMLAAVASPAWLPDTWAPTPSSWLRRAWSWRSESTFWASSTVGTVTITCAVARECLLGCYLVSSGKVLEIGEDLLRVFHGGYGHDHLCSGRGWPSYSSPQFLSQLYVLVHEPLGSPQSNSRAKCREWRAKRTMCTCAAARQHPFRPPAALPSAHSNGRLPPHQDYFITAESPSTSGKGMRKGKG